MQRKHWIGFDEADTFRSRTQQLEIRFIVEQKPLMKQLLGLWRDSWIHWVMFIAIIIALSVLLNVHFIWMLSLLPAQFAYFAFVRYDENGIKRMME